MIKNIKVGNKEMTLSNSITWTMIYRDQFGHDIVSTLTPIAAGMLDLTSGFIESMGEDGQIELVDVARNLDGDKLIDAIAHLSGLEFVDMINITWAMAKAADEDLPDPRRWASEFEVFPVDVIIPEVVRLAMKGLVSTKNLKRLGSLKKKIKMPRPSTSTPSSSQESSEGSPFPTFAG